jgi:hypothetical protein
MFGQCVFSCAPIVNPQRIIRTADGSLAAVELYISPAGLPSMRVLATGSSITTLIINLSKVM